MLSDAVAADGNERVEPVFPETAQHFVAAVNFRERTIRLRHAQLEWVAVIARAQNRAAEVRDVANERARQFDQPAIGIVFGMEQSIESVADAEDFPAVIARGMDGRMDDGIQSRRVAAAGIDGDSFDGRSWSRFSGRGSYFEAHFAVVACASCGCPSSVSHPPPSDL